VRGSPPPSSILHKRRRHLAPQAFNCRRRRRLNPPEGRGWTPGTPRASRRQTNPHGVSQAVPPCGGRYLKGTNILWFPSLPPFASAFLSPGLIYMTDAPGEIVWHGYIRRQFKDVSGVFVAWSNKCERILVGEHDPHDEETSIHCHILIVNSKVKKEQLQRIQKEFLPGLAKNDHWIMELTQGKKDKERIPYKTSYLAPYVLKGNAAKYSLNFSEEELEFSRLAWVPPKKPGEIQSTIIFVKPPKRKDTRKEMLLQMTEQYLQMPEADQDKKHKVVILICKVLRLHGHGINKYHVREYYHALKFDADDPFCETVSACVQLLSN